MSDKMTPIPLNQLLNWMLGEYNAQQSIFGIHKNIFFKKQESPAIGLFDESLETVVGPAAGPHTQLAQNIITAYMVGARFFELKTVQKMDRLEIRKPCIDASDECYNIEWSQELRLEQSYDEYLKAWLLLPVLKHLFGLSQNTENGFIFNMSVGYDLAGIQTPAMDHFINSMQNASFNPLFEQYKTEIHTFLKSNKDQMLAAGIETAAIEKAVDNIGKISSKISGSVTLSTMHGCPPQEIEAIANYLMQEKNLHTYVKLNPTLLGYDYVSTLLHNLGYDYINLDPESFHHDLNYSDALGMLSRLQETAHSTGKSFGIKLSNTLGVINKAKKLNDTSMYMSGRSLFPLTINLAAKLATDFNGQLNISYSGGADQDNVADILNCVIFPVTMVTDLLKPGGYQRLLPIVQKAESSIVNFARIKEIDTEKLKLFADSAHDMVRYKKENRGIDSIKVEKKLPAFDCYMAPCQQACPIHQDVAQYIRLVEEGRYSEAIETIMLQNPLPHITGYICDHQCMNHCTRWDYDSPLLIRDLKLEAAKKGFDAYLENFRKHRPIPKNTIKIAIVGAGPSGLAAAYFLAKAGCNVTVFEKNEKAGGVVSHALPSFRLPQDAINKDIDFIKEHGVSFKFSSDPDFSVAALKKAGYDYIFLAIGAGKSNRLAIPGMNGNLLEAITFLERFNRGENLNLGKSVAIIGGGNSAMDAARAAKRLKTVEHVYIIYRRTKEFMPADLEEFEGAMNDGVIFKELLSPLNYNDGSLRCQKMQLGVMGDDGRRIVQLVHDQHELLKVDTIISAIGEQVDFDFLEYNGLLDSTSGKLHVDPQTNETIIPNVFIGGDALRGPATVVEAIADGRKVADTIIKRENIKLPPGKNLNSLFNTQQRKDDLTAKKGTLLPLIQSDMQAEASRCLNCSFSCDKCVDVCPNRANISISVPGFNNNRQVLHLDALCNECGNCDTFCPYQGAPYKDKPTIFWSEDDFDDSRNDGFYVKKKQGTSENQQIKIRQNGKTKWFYWSDTDESSDSFSALIYQVVANHSYLI
ncbi:MAG: putative selenate reductase subunit YgfK [Calditrichaeota bacterium]|nr:putative selenate reductase subunit YgfK [Calditrichota bacterium]